MTYNAAEFGNKESARKLYQQALDKAETFTDFLNVSESVANEGSFGDKEWARTICQTAFNKAKEPGELRQISFHVAKDEFLDDKEWGMDIYQKALEWEIMNRQFSHRGNCRSINRSNVGTRKTWQQLRSWGKRK